MTRRLPLEKRPEEAKATRGKLEVEYVGGNAAAPELCTAPAKALRGEQQPLRQGLQPHAHMMNE